MQDGHASPSLDHAQPPLADPRLLIAATLAALLFAGSAAVLRGRAYALPLPRVALLGKARETPNEFEIEPPESKPKSPNAQAGPSNYRDNDDATHVHTDSTESKATARSKDRRRRGKDVTKGKKGRALLESVSGTISHSRTPSTALPTSPMRTEPKTPNAPSSSRSVTPPLCAPTPGPAPSENFVASRGRSGSPDPSSPSPRVPMAPRGPSPRLAAAQAHADRSAAVSGDELSSRGLSEDGVSVREGVGCNDDGGDSRDTQPELKFDQVTLRWDSVTVELGDLAAETETETETETEGTTAASSVVLDVPSADTVKTDSASRGGIVAPTLERELRSPSSNATPIAPAAKQPNTSSSTNPRRPHTPVRLNNGSVSGRSDTPPMPTSPRGAAFSAGSVPSSPSPFVVAFGSTSASSSSSSSIHLGSNSSSGHVTTPSSTTNTAAPNVSNNNNSGTPALSLQTQVAGLRGALEAARLREEKHKAEIERMVKDAEAVRWENGVLRRTESELHSHIRQLTYQVQQYAALLAGVAPHMQQQQHQQMQIQMQLHQMQYSAQTQAHAGLAQANPSQAQTNHAQLQRLRHRASGSLGGVSVGVGVNGYTGSGIGMTPMNPTVLGPMPMRTHTPAQSVSITPEAEIDTATAAAEVVMEAVEEEAGLKIKNDGEKEESGGTDVSLAQAPTQTSDQNGEVEEDGEGPAQEQQQKQTNVASQNHQNEIQSRTRTQNEGPQGEEGESEEDAQRTQRQIQAPGQTQSQPQIQQAQVQNGHRHTPSAGYAGQQLPAPLHLTMLSTPHPGTMSPAMGMMSPTGLISPMPAPIAVGMPMPLPMGYPPGPFSPPVSFSPYAVSALPPWGALTQQQSSAAYHHHHQQLSQLHQHQQHQQQPHPPAGTGSGAPSAQHAASLFSMPTVYSTGGGAGSSGSSSAGSRSPDVHGSPNLGSTSVNGGGNGIQRLQRIRHAAASRGSTRMPWEDTGDGWTSPHTYAQSDGPSAPGPSAYVDQNSDQDGEETSDDAEGVSSFLADAILKRPESIGMGAVRGGTRSRPALKNAFGLEVDDTGDNVPRGEDGEGDQHEKEAEEEERLVEFTFPSLSDLGNPRRNRSAESTSSTDSGSASPAVLTALPSAGTEPEEVLVHPALPPASVSDPELFAASQIQTPQGSEDALPAVRSADSGLAAARDS